LALTLQRNAAEGLSKTNLLKPRTEIVLKDVNDVAFWFSISLPLATFPQPTTGERAFLLIHQTLGKPGALFPRIRSIGEKITSREDESADQN
jgi:hypothetical protein